MERWVCALTGVASNGNITQLYPANASAGVNPATATNGQLIRKPCEGTLYSMQIETDGTNPGTVQLWDINGIEIGVDVSSAAALTDTQVSDAITAGLAKLIYEQNFTASPATPIGIGYASFQKGLAARFVGSGSCKLNLVVSGGYRKTEKVG